MTNIQSLPINTTPEGRYIAARRALEKRIEQIACGHPIEGETTQTLIDALARSSYEWGKAAAIVDVRGRVIEMAQHGPIPLADRGGCSHPHHLGVDPDHDQCPRCGPAGPDLGDGTT